MSVYFVTGKLGAGKTLVTVGKMRDALQDGRAVATNVDLDLTKLVKRTNKTACVYRLPDKPRLCDMEALGYGDGSNGERGTYDEKKFGVIVLDEIGTWLNARSWNDKERGPLLDWFRHARKMRWHLYILIQDINGTDKQLREATAEFVVRCMRLHNFRVPLIGWIGKALWGKPITMPAIHIAHTFYGTHQGAEKVDGDWYRGTDLYEAYDTGQVFESGFVRYRGEPIDMRGISRMLPPYYTHGRYDPQDRRNIIARAIATIGGTVSGLLRQAAAHRAGAWLIRCGIVPPAAACVSRELERRPDGTRAVPIGRKVSRGELLRLEQLEVINQLCR